MSQVQRIVEFLKETPGMRYSTQEIADVLELNRKSVCVFVRSAWERGLLQSDTRRTRCGRVGFRYWVEA